MNEPPASDDGFGPETFRADLLHQGGLSLNRWRRGLIAAGVALFMLLGVGAAQVWGYFFADLPTIPASESLGSIGRQPGITFQDRYGRIIATRGPKYGQSIRLAELPAYVPRAFLAAEDRRFYSHDAADLWGSMRALVANIRGGRVVEGGSTITQQLTRNLFLTRGQNLKRKVQEIVLGEKLEHRLGKNGVLELYLNRIYFGRGAYGLDAAAHAYFGKPARSLSVGEAAFLAALPKSPLRYGHDTAAGLQRERLVLSRMVREGWLTPKDAANAGALPLVMAGREPEGDLSWALDMAADQARDVAGPAAHDLVVRLTLDPALQRQAGDILRTVLDGDGRKVGAGQGAVVLLGPDGAIRALIGGRDYAQSQFDRAVLAQRQPGSAFKPFVWAAALETGARPEQFRSTKPVAFGPWSPRDHGAEGAAELTLADALARSSNGVSVRLAQEAGPRRVVMLGRRFGLSRLPDEPGLSIALGAYETSLLELTGAYQVFQQGGRFSRPWLVEEVARSDGTVLYRRPPERLEIVFEPARASAMVSMMSGVIDHGTGRRAALGRPAAGKTGTTQDNRDAWFVGFTPDWAAGVWVGNDDGRPMRGVAGGDLPAEIWRRLMTAAHQGLPPRSFDEAPEKAPAGPAEETVVFENRQAFYATLAAEFARVAEAPR